MATSSCTISFLRNDLQRTRLQQGKCPIKNCSVNIQKHTVPFRHNNGELIRLPFCPEHGLRIHKSGFVYYNGPTKEALIIATKRNLMLHADYYIEHFLKTTSKAESHRLCYESSEDAVTYNVFTELLSKRQALTKLTKHISEEKNTADIELHLWGGKIDLTKKRFLKYEPLAEVRNHLEADITGFPTEPDIMIIIPKKLLVCIEAKFGSKNPLVEERAEKIGEKPKRRENLIERYCNKNKIIRADNIFNLKIYQGRFYEQLFRNIVFAASMAKLAGIERWYVVNLRSQHVINLKKGKPESAPVTRNVRSMLKPNYKKRFLHLTWEDVYNKCVRDNTDLHDLAWYMKNKTLNCRRAFNIF